MSLQFLMFQFIVVDFFFFTGVDGNSDLFVLQHLEKWEILVIANPDGQMRLKLLCY